MRAAEGGLLARALRTAGRFLLRVPLPLALLIVALWIVAIWDLSSHRVPIPKGKSLWWEFLSNLAHAPLFGVLTLWIAAVLLRERDGAWPRPRLGRSALVFACVLAYGVLDELHQSHVPGRDASALDVLTDGVSAAMVLWIVRTLGDERREGVLYARLALGVALCSASAGLALLS
jgi:VanZ family protein